MDKGDQQRNKKIWEVEEYMEWLNGENETEMKKWRRWENTGLQQVWAAEWDRWKKGKPAWLLITRVII